MIYRQLIKILIAGILAICLSVSCKEKVAYIYFLVKVDSVQVTQNPVANTPFDISFFGQIGVNGCCSFDHFVVKQENLDINIEAWGKVDNTATICPTVNVYMTGHIVTYTVSIPGTYKLRIILPNDKYFEHQIIIK